MDNDLANRPFTWTFDSVISYILAIIGANDQRYEQRFVDSQTATATALTAARIAVDAALSAAKEAVLKAEGASEKRFEGVNEFRQTLADQQRTLMPRAEAELRMASLEYQIKELKNSDIAFGANRSGMKQMGGIVFGIIGIVFGFVTLLLTFFAK